MVTLNRPKSITITVRDREKNKSNTITVYNSTLEVVVEKIKDALRN
ncbi:MAG: hypothetical protein NT120_04675 [Candidatus Aenigmarchaeota archaeon]|nr:hypothetical protein [Candidatus Aenigmarchaeota archaeon]